MPLYLLCCRAVPCVGQKARCLSLDLSISQMKRLTNFLIVASTYGALACLGIALTRTTWGVSSIWPANGLIVGLFYNGRNTYWSDLVSAVAIGGFIANGAIVKSGVWAA